MACNNIIHELFVSVQKTLHERFAIIEEVIKIETSKLETEATSVNTDFANLSNQVKSLSENVADITRTLKELSDKLTKHIRMIKVKQFMLLSLIVNHLLQNKCLEI